jgi:hypothetical protein
MPALKEPPHAQDHEHEHEHDHSLSSGSEEEEAKTEIEAPDGPSYPPWIGAREAEDIFVQSSNLCDLVGLENPRGSEDPKEIFFNSSDMCDLALHEQNSPDYNNTYPKAETSRYKEIHIDPESLFSSDEDDSSDMCDLALHEQNSPDYNNPYPKADTSRYTEIHIDPESLFSSDEDDMKPAAQPVVKRQSHSQSRNQRRVVPDTEQDMDLVLQKSTDTELKHQKGWSPLAYLGVTKKPEPIPEPLLLSREAEIPPLLRRLEMNGIDWDTRLSVLCDLILILWTSGVSAKETFIECKGVESITKLMWADMSDSSIQELVVQLLLALTASVDADPVNDVLKGERIDSTIDALMIVMQVLVDNETIQEYGCRIFSCLAAASSVSPGVSDGTLCGAVQTVVNALDAHPQSQSIQECALQALFHMCAYSKNADSNKLALVKGESNGILLALKNEAFESPTVAEWACKLYWSLSQDRVDMIPSSQEVIEEMLHLIRGQHQNTDFVELLTAAVGTIANMVKVEHNQERIDATGSIMLALDLIQFQQEDVRIIIECCCLIGNLAELSPDMDVFAEEGGVNLMVDAILRFPDNEVLYEEAVRALACLSIRSNTAKKALCEPGVLANTIQLCRGDETPAHVHEMVCTLLSSIFASNDSSPGADLAFDAVESVCFAMRAHPQSLNVQDAGSFALRNLSHQNDNVCRLLGKQALRPLIAAMIRFEHHRPIQLNGCCILWNIGSRVDKEEAVFDELKCVECIVKVIQNHLEEAEVLEMACGALWSLIYNCNTRKERLLGAGGVDAVACLFFMHPHTATLLENAGGVFSSLSASASSSGAITSNQGIGIMVDTMRNNGSSVLVLQTGTLFLRNMILICSEDCWAEAERAITSVMNKMRETTDEGFQAEACNFLWVLSALSENGKSKILALDGITILMETLEKYSAVVSVTTAALGAFAALSISSR